MDASKKEPIVDQVDDAALEAKPASVVSESAISPEQKRAERKIVGKVDRSLIAILGVLYSISGIDRVNLSNARVAGMNKDLRFDIGDRYSVALLVFFVTYFLFEMPWTLSLRRLGPPRQLCGLVLAWGGVMLGMGFAQDWRAVVVCRLLIGVFEAGFLPCCMYLLSSWYQRYEVQQRMALWYMINLFVSAFGNILAYALIKLDGVHGIQGWRWIFIVEGAITVGFAFVGYVFVLPFPDQMLASGQYKDDDISSSSSSWLKWNPGKPLTRQELETVLDRVERDRGDAAPDRLIWPKAMRLACDGKLWMYGFLFMGSSAPIYAFAYFIQIILTTLNGGRYTTAQVFLLCAPPYLASMVWTYAVAWAADKSRCRMPWMVLNAALTLTGLLLTAYHHSSAVRYFGVFLGVAGCNANLPTVIAFQSNNVRSNSRRSVASGVQMLFAALGGIYASCTFMEREYPSYRTGVWCAVATQALLILLVLVLSVHFRRRNALADAGRLLIQDEAGFRYTY